jgi:hypothetical protein
MKMAGRSRRGGNVLEKVSVLLERMSIVERFAG